MTFRNNLAQILADARTPQAVDAPVDAPVDEPGDELYDPADHSTKDVVAHLADVDADERARIIAAEADGKQRSTILSAE